MSEEIFEQIDKIIEEVNEYKIDPIFNNEINSRLGRNQKILDSGNSFLKLVSILIAFSQNAKSSIVADLLNNSNVFNEAFDNFNVNTVAKMSQEQIVEDYWPKIKAIRFKKKIGFIIKCAQVIQKIGDENGSFLCFFQKAQIPLHVETENDLENFWKGFDILLVKFRASGMPFLNQTTTLLHLLLEMGYYCVKPDLILLKFADEIGINNSINNPEELKEFVRIIQEYCLSRKIEPSLIDLYLLIYGGQTEARRFVRPEYYGLKDIKSKNKTNFF